MTAPEEGCSRDRKKSNFDYDFEQINSCLVPILKTITAPRCTLRFIWGFYCAFMVAFLGVGIFIVVTKYMSHVMVVRVDSISTIEALAIIPAITICPGEYSEKMLKQQIRPDSASYQMYHDKMRNFEIIKGASKIGSLEQKFSMEWHSKTDGHSLLYNITREHFSLNFNFRPGMLPLKMQIFEQVTSQTGDVCITAELEVPESNQDEVQNSFLKYITLDIYNTRIKQWQVILHSRNFYPFENHGKNIYYELGSNKNQYPIVFFTMNQYLRLNTPNNYCEDNEKNLFFGRKFSFDHALCNANQTCFQQRNAPRCVCSWDVLRRAFNKSLSEDVEGGQLIQANNEEVSPECWPQAFAVKCGKPCKWTNYKLDNFIWKPNQGNAYKTMIVMGESSYQFNEEELYSIPRLISEIGGLSSFFFGFSIFVIFEVLHLLTSLRTLPWFQCKKNDKKNSLVHGKVRTGPNCKLERQNKQLLSSSGYLGMVSMQGRRFGLESLRCARDSLVSCSDSPLLVTRKAIIKPQQTIELINSEFEFEGILYQTVLEIVKCC